MTARRILAAAAILTILVTSIILLTAGSAAHATVAAPQPYGGCAEAWQAPSSEGADDCRKAGWTVRKRVVLNPHAVLRYWDLPACTYEDASSGPVPCGWLGHTDGNKRGNSYFVTGTNEKPRFHYLWSPNPLRDRPHRNWVGTGLADALAEGSSEGATTRDWSQCWTRKSSATCADGHKEVW